MVKLGPTSRIKSRDFCPRKTQDLTEAAVRSQKNAIFSAARSEHSIVNCALKPFINDAFNVMSSCSQQLKAATTNIFVRFQFHAPLGTDRIRSREASAP